MTSADALRNRLSALTAELAKAEKALKKLSAFVECAGHLAPSFLNDVLADQRQHAVGLERKIRAHEDYLARLEFERLAERLRRLGPVRAGVDGHDEGYDECYDEVDGR